MVALPKYDRYLLLAGTGWGTIEAGFAALPFRRCQPGQVLCNSYRNKKLGAFNGHYFFETGAAGVTFHDLSGKEATRAGLHYVQLFYGCLSLSHKLDVTVSHKKKSLAGLKTFRCWNDWIIFGDPSGRDDKRNKARLRHFSFCLYCLRATFFHSCQRKSPRFRVSFISFVGRTCQSSNQLMDDLLKVQLLR